MRVVLGESRKNKSINQIIERITRNVQSIGVIIHICVLKYLNLYACILATIKNPHTKDRMSIYIPK